MQNFELNGIIYEAPSDGGYVWELRPGRQREQVVGQRGATLMCGRGGLEQAVKKHIRILKRNEDHMYGVCTRKNCCD